MTRDVWELHSLLRHDNVSQLVQQRPRLSQTAADVKLSELNDIRNLLAHLDLLQALPAILGPRAVAWLADRARLRFRAAA